MSTLHSRLPDAGSSGPGIHSSSEGSVCGDLKLSAIFEICVHPICKICVHPICHKTNIQAYTFLLLVPRVPSPEERIARSGAHAKDSRCEVDGPGDRTARTDGRRNRDSACRPHDFRAPSEWLRPVAASVWRPRGSGTGAEADRQRELNLEYSVLSGKVSILGTSAG